MKFNCMKKIAISGLIIMFSNFASAGLIFQDDFESGTLAPWVIASGSPVLSQVEALSGIYSVAAMGGDQIKISFSETAVSDISELSIWIKRDSDLLNSFTFFYSDNTSSGSFLSQKNPTNDWFKFDFINDLSVGKSLVGFAIYGTSPGPAYLDDFTLTTSANEIPEPSTLVIFALSLIGLGCLRFNKLSE